MEAIAGYYDGAVVVPSRKLKNNQQVLIIPIEATEDTGGGLLHQYAVNGQEKIFSDIAKEAAIKRYERSKESI